MFAHNTGAWGYVDNPLPNIVYIALWMPACIVWLYYYVMYLNFEAVFGHFFFSALCVGSLDKKKLMLTT